MNNKVKISIIMPIYNVEKYLERGIRSILNQTFKEFELVLINDGSTDNSSIICDKYKNIDRRVKVIHRSNNGVSSSRNIGIDIAVGEFIMFVDPDDTLEIDAVEYLYNLIKLYNSDVACYRMKIYKNGNLTTKIDVTEKVELYYNENIIEKQLKDELFLYSSCNKLYNSNLLKNNKFNEDIKYAEDALFNLSIFTNCNLVVISNLCKYNYFINESSTVNNFNEKRLDILKAQYEMFNILKSKYDNYTDYIVRDFVSSSISIIIDMAILGERNIEIISKLKNIIKDNEEMLKSKKLVNYKQKIIFQLLKIMPFIILSLYKIRFSLKNINKR